MEGDPYTKPILTYTLTYNSSMIIHSSLVLSPLHIQCTHIVYLCATCCRLRSRGHGQDSAHGEAGGRHWIRPTGGGTECARPTDVQPNTSSQPSCPAYRHSMLHAQQHVRSQLVSVPSVSYVCYVVQYLVFWYGLVTLTRWI